MIDPMAGAVRRLQARRIRRLLLLIGGLVVLLIVVAALPQGRHRGSLAVPTDPRIAGSAAGVVQGVLHGSRSGDRVCFWVDGPAGRVYLVFPKGWSADAHLDLRDAAGGVQGAPGLSAAFLGTPRPVATLPGCPGAGRTWWTTEVRRGSGPAPSAP